MTKTVRYAVVPADDTLPIRWEETADTSTSIHTAVGGYFECIALTQAEDVSMWLNEDGKGMALPWNPRAQYLFDRAYGPGQDYVVGDVVILGGADKDGETLGVPDWFAIVLNSVSNVWREFFPSADGGAA